MDFDYRSKDIFVSIKERWIQDVDGQRHRVPQSVLKYLKYFLDNPGANATGPDIFRAIHGKSKKYSNSQLNNGVWKIRTLFGRDAIITENNEDANGILAARYHWAYPVQISLNLRSIRKALVGEWVEIIPGQPDRPISLSEFRYNPRTENLSYCGANYTVRGDRHYQWESNFVTIEQERRNLLYVYTVTLGSGSEGKGFGCFSFGNDETRIEIVSGYFMDADEVTGYRQSILVRRIEEVVEGVKQETGLNFSLASDAGRSQFTKALADSAYFRHWLSGGDETEARMRVVQR